MAPPVVEDTNPVKYFPRVLRYLRPYWRLAVFSVALIILGALASLLAPWPLKILIDSVLQDHPLSPVVAFLVGPLADSRFGLMLFAVIGGVRVDPLPHRRSLPANHLAPHRTHE